jgi:GH25 family lysozyme M1 (1,4-beta-N-acetylmuramidase)
MIQGFDVSHWQGDVSWSNLKQKHNIEFGACKATEGTGFLDPRFTQNWSRLEAASLVRMAYHFARPARDVKQSAQFFLTTVKNAGLHDDDKLVLDLETGDGLSQSQVNAWSKEWAKIVRDATGNIPIVYMGSAYLSNNTGNGFNGPFSGLWYPRYPTAWANGSTFPSNFTPPVPIGSTSWGGSNWGELPTMWQFSASFKSAEGSIDANISPLTATQLRELGVPDVALTQAEITKIADAVWKRKTYNKVQSDIAKAADPNAELVYSEAEDLFTYTHYRTAKIQEFLEDPANTPPGTVSVSSIDTPTLQLIAKTVLDELAKRVTG